MKWRGWVKLGVGMALGKVTDGRALAERDARSMILLADGKLVEDHPNDGEE